MKNLFCLSCFILLIFTTSCEKDKSLIREDEKTKLADYSSAVSQRRISLAKTLTKAFSSNPELLTIAIKECNKKFDGDFDVLCKTLFAKSITNTLKSGGRTFGEAIGYYSNKNNFKSNSLSTEELLSNDPNLQLYYCRGLNSSDQDQIDGIVVLPEEFTDGENYGAILVEDDGSVRTILENENEDKNYLVISNNERFNNEFGGNIGMIIDRPEFEAHKTMVINRAKFTSLDAKRTVESRWKGEPEVILTVTYNSYDRNTKTWNGKYSTFPYPCSWIDYDFFTVWTVWNNARVELPTWWYSIQSFERKLTWIEDDGKVNKTEVNISLPNVNGVTVTSKMEIPQSSSYDLIAENNIDYFSLVPGINYWGLIQFELESSSYGVIPPIVIYN